MSAYDYLLLIECVKKYKNNSDFNILYDEHHPLGLH